MVARVTLAEIDSVRTSVARLVERFEESVVPEVQAQPGYEGCCVLTTPEGKALVLTFWADADAAEASAGARYAAQVEKFVTVIRSEPGRETYEVAVADLPHTAVAY
jgi:heme-degrading monooxygenase HmoA